MQTSREMTNLRFRAETPPPKKEGWNHSEQVLVYYEAIPELDLVDKWGIAYYHYNPPFKNKPEWIDFFNPNRVPTYWWELPTL
jgi:hypothetical protein